MGGPGSDKTRSTLMGGKKGTGTDVCLDGWAAGHEVWWVELSKKRQRTLCLLVYVELVAVGM
jgi:hypothetical protein